MTCTRSFGGPLGLTENGLRAVGWPDCLRRFRIKLSRVIPNQIVWFWVGPILTRVMTTSLTAIWSNFSRPTGKLFQFFLRLLTYHLMVFGAPTICWGVHVHIVCICTCMYNIVSHKFMYVFECMYIFHASMRSFLFRENQITTTALCFYTSPHTSSLIAARDPCNEVVVSLCRRNTIHQGRWTLFQVYVAGMIWGRQYLFHQMYSHQSILDQSIWCLIKRWV